LEWTKNPIELSKWEEEKGEEDITMNVGRWRNEKQSKRRGQSC